MTWSLPGPCLHGASAVASGLALHRPEAVAKCETCRGVVQRPAAIVFLALDALVTALCLVLVCESVRHRKDAGNKIHVGTMNTLQILPAFALHL
jgi:hypothetical protein